jgi:hypothetical protein
MLTGNGAVWRRRSHSHFAYKHLKECHFFNQQENHTTQNTTPCLARAAPSGYQSDGLVWRKRVIPGHPMAPSICATSVADTRKVVHAADYEAAGGRFAKFDETITFRHSSSIHFQKPRLRPVVVSTNHLAGARNVAQNLRGLVTGPHLEVHAGLTQLRRRKLGRLRNATSSTVSTA